MEMFSTYNTVGFSFITLSVMVTMHKAVQKVKWQMVGEAGLSYMSHK